MSIDPNAYEVRGVVVDANGRPLSAIGIRAYDRHLGRETMLGQAVTDASGGYLITLPASLYGKTPKDRGGPELFVRVHDAQGALIAQSAVVTNAGPRTMLNLTVSSDARIVTGTIRDDASRTAAGLTVQAFDRDLRSEELLGQAATDAQGRYRIAYTASQFRRAEKANADVLVRVVATDNKTVLASSGIHFNALTHIEIDLTVPFDRLQTESEWERYRRELAPLLGYADVLNPAQGLTTIPRPLPPHELTDEDLDFIHGETGLPLDRLRAIRLSAQWQQQHKGLKALSPEGFYGLLRQGLPVVLARLLRTGPTRWRSALKASLGERIVTAAFAAQFEAFIAALSELAIETSFAPMDAKDPDAPGVGALIAASAIPVPQQRLIVATLLDQDFRDDPKALTDALQKAGLKDDAIRPARFAMESFPLLHHHLPTLAALQRDIAVGFGAAADLAQVQREQWLALAQQQERGKALPAGFKSAADYASSLADAVELRYPTQVVAHVLRAEKAPLRQAVGQLLLAQPAFDLLRDDVQPLVDKMDFSTIDAPRAAVVEQLYAEIRVARLAPPTQRTVAMSALLKEGLDSAVKVSRAGAVVVKRKLVPTIGDAAAKHVIMQADARLADATLHLNRLGDLIAWQHLPHLPRLPLPATAPPPTWARMFGAAGACTCLQCESVHGPAAYLADLLNFLSRMDDGSGRSLLEVLTNGRRADLRQLKLDCANAETPLPYIDLVIEQLERVMVPSLPVAQTSADRNALWLRALPEQAPQATPLYRRDGPLMAARYPWNLPFDREHRLASIHLSLAGASAADVLHHLGGNETDTARARLGMNSAVWQILHGRVESDAAAIAAAWGVRTLDPLLDVPMLLKHASLTWSELRDLIASPLFAPLRLDLNLGAQPCDISGHRLMRRSEAGPLVELVGVPRMAAFDLLHRMLRLRQAMGWPLATTLRVLQALGVHAAEVGAIAPHPAAIDLIAVARMVEMSRRLDIDAATLADHLLALTDATSQQHARAALAALLGSSVIELDSLADLGATMHPELAATGAERLLHLETAHATLARLREARIDPAELRFLLRGLDLVPAAFAPIPADIDTSLDGFLTALRDIPTPTSGEPDPRPDVVVEQLMAITGNALVSAVVPLLRATVASVPGDVTQDFVAFATDESVHRVHAERSLRRVIAATRLAVLLKLTSEDLGALTTVDRDDSTWLDFDALVPPPDAVPPYPAPQWAAFQRLLLVSLAQATLPENADRLLPLLTRDTSVAAIDEATGWGQLLGLSPTESASALSELFSILRDDSGLALVLGQPDTVYRLQQTARWLQGRRLRVADARLMRAAAEDTTSATDLSAFSRARFLTERAWLAALAPSMDRLRVEQRDALLAHLLHTRAAEFPSVQALYDRLLIDVQMGACQLSSRIVHAHGAIQLFVQRCLMKLEPGVSLGDVSNIQEWKQWTWMKQYRVWEAGRKIFLYPENWIEPDLRLGKSPFFEAFENELLQDELKPEAVERAVRNYLVQLHEVAKLDIRAIYEELYDEPMADGSQATRRVLHMVGRTRGVPHVHYYRRREHDLNWSAWEKIDLTIDADHLTLAVHNRRPMLFWPQWQALEVEKEGGVKTRVWDMLMNHSTLEFGRWAAPGQSTGSMQLPRSPNDARPGIALRPRLSDNSSRIEVLVYRYLPSNLNVVRPALGFMVAATAFVLDACTGEIRIAPLPQPTLRFLPAGVDGFEQGLLERMDDAGSVTSLRNGLRDEPERPVDSGAVAFSELLRTGGLGGILAALVLAADDAFVEGVRNALDDPATSVRLFHGAVDGYRLIPAQQYAQWNNEQPYVLQHSGRQLLAVRRSEGFAIHLFGGYIWVAPSYQLESGEHPYACDLLEAVRAEGVDGVYRPAERIDADGSVVALGDKRHPRQVTVGRDWVSEDLRPNASLVRTPYPRDRFEFAATESYGLYNWEVFFHIPLLIADRMSKHQNYEEAQRWLHTLFDPTDVSPHPAPQKYWRVKPLFEESSRWTRGTAETLEAMMRRLSRDATDVAEQVRRWRNDPFDPHLIASMRVIAYMKTVLQKYVQNLLDWGDSLFRRDTMESIQEATQLYELAAYILGSEPAVIDLPHHPARTYDELASLDTIDDFSNVLVDFETGLPIAQATRPGERPAPALTNLYFCIPTNARLTELRATVADRLFKIRHCMDLDGRTRQLALFAPPIDPALLVRARASGLDIGTAIEQAITPASSPYRFSFLLGKAMELTSEVRAFGAALLSALEKRDAEQLMQLRARHDVQTQKLALQTREKQVEEAEAQLDAAMGTRALAEFRRDHYASLLEAGLSASENAHIANLHAAHGFEMSSGALRTVAGLMHLLPETKIGVTPAIIWGGPNLGRALDSAASALGLVAQQFSFEASMAGYNATYERRAQEWQQQIAQADHEIAQIDQQIIAAEIRVQIAKQELRAHLQQARRFEEVEAHLRDKFTGTQLYHWMSAQLAQMHYQSYRMAFDLADRAAHAAEAELGISRTLLGFDHWDSGRKGFLAGDRLGQDLRRLEMAYIHANARRFELTTHVSLRRIDTISLLNLRRNGHCRFQLPGALFAADFPGHTGRTIKSVSVSIPGVVGPYTGVCGMLTCEQTGWGPRQIATSSGQADAGVFQLDPRDERYLPFEGTQLDRDTATTWRFELPSTVRSFDYDTISDLVLHIQYTARSATDEIVAVEPVAGDRDRVLPGASGMRLQLLDPRHDFPDAWRQLHDGAASVEVALENRLFPYGARVDRMLDIQAFRVSEGADLSAYPAIVRAATAAAAPGLLLEPADVDGVLVVAYRFES